MLYIFITSAHTRPASASDGDVTRVPDDQSERQALLSDGHVPRRYSHDERLASHNDDGGRLLALPDADPTDLSV